MTEPLWTWGDLLAASGAVADGAPEAQITGFSLDTRSLQTGEVFVAIRDVRDGHDFVLEAFRKGAAAALVEAGYKRVAGRWRLTAGRQPARRIALNRARCPCSFASGHRCYHRQRRQDRHQGGAACVPVAARGDARSRKIVQQPLGRAADARAHAGLGPLRRVRDRHEPRGRDRAAVEARAPAGGDHHHGRAGAPEVLLLGCGHRRGEGGDLRRARAGRHRDLKSRQSVF